MVDIFQSFADKEGFEIIDDLGHGKFGVVKEILYKDKIYAGKLIKKEKYYENESKIIQEFRGPGIVKVNTVFEQKINGENYYLIVMEKAGLSHLYKLINGLHKENWFHLIYKKPFELVGDNLIRFFTKQLMAGLELLNRSDFSHFDIKPGNILIFNHMNAKFTDFGLLRMREKIKDRNNMIEIPGGTRGYLSPEYYSNNGLVKVEDAIKQDLFAFGSTLFNFKYGEEMLEYNKYMDSITTADVIINKLQKAFDLVRSRKTSDKDFIEFICSLIQYKPEERPDFDKIYRNKWLHKNSQELINIYGNFEIDNTKLLLELDKSDFLIKKRDKINALRKNQNKKDNVEINRNKFRFSLKSKKSILD